MAGDGFIKLEILGIDKVDKVLSRLPDKLKRKVLLKIFRKSAKITVTAAKAAAPKDTGTLSKSISAFVGRSKEYPTLYVGPRVKKRLIKKVNRANRGLKGANKRKLSHYGTGGWYGHFVEYGISKNRKRKGKGSTGSTNADPFMERAISQTQATVNTFISNDIIQYVKTSAKELAK
tara:strand:+ start:1171 stop:1698 length:528 start_codon:yes stop_codon:yes gene_type:complete